MSVPIVAFFNNKGGVGKTSMVYHLSWMFAERGVRVVAADLDPQSNLTASFLDDAQLETILEGDKRRTVFGALQPLKRGVGDIREANLEDIAERLALLPGDMALSTFEDQLSETWPKCMDRDERAFRVTSAFWRIAQEGAQRHGAEIVLFDLGPNLGAINRAALIGSDHVVIPLGADLFSLQGLRNLGPAIRRWREDWAERLKRNPAAELSLPSGSIQPIGYVVLRHSERMYRPVKAYERWIAKIPATYAEYVLEEAGGEVRAMNSDPNLIARLKDYRSLMPLAQEARKPMFLLKAADGALGAHTYAVRDAYLDFQTVAEQIAERIRLSVR